MPEGQLDLLSFGAVEGCASPRGVESFGASAAADDDELRKGDDVANGRKPGIRALIALRRRHARQIIAFEARARNYRDLVAMVDA